MNEISVTDLKSKHDAGEDFLLLDVREPDELATALDRVGESDPDARRPPRISTSCQKINRSRSCVTAAAAAGRITQFLNENGYPNAVNVAGGIDAWSTQIDPTVPTY